MLCWKSVPPLEQLFYEISKLSRRNRFIFCVDFIVSVEINKRAAYRYYAAAASNPVVRKAVGWLKALR